jgi:CheY-like chemotaxis protein
MTFNRICFLVDDDPDDQEIFKLILAELDSHIHCVTALNGAEALEYLKIHPTFHPDFIFLDLNMPRMNGKQCLIELRKIHKLRAVPIIIYSTSAEARDIEEMTRLGATRFITKPSDLTILSQRLAEVFREPSNA